MEDIIFTNFQPEYKQELNTWQEKETASGTNGLNDFVVAETTLLGDYLAFIDRSITDINARLAFDQEDLVGFICYSNPNENHTYIEIMGVNPDCRGQGYASRILTSFKEEIQSNSLTKQKITLSTKENNHSGIAAFSKVGKISETQDKENYINFEL